MDLFDKLTEKKKRLDAHHPLPPALVDNLQAWFRIELTYTSNAIEGNTLSRAQTALVADKGITIEGKTLREQIEVVNHIRALDIEPQDSSVKPLLPVLKIGELAKMSGESVPTIRYWTQQGLLQPVRYTAGHYSLYSPTAIEQVKHIRYLQQHERLSIAEIKARLRR